MPTSFIILKSRTYHFQLMSTLSLYKTKICYQKDKMDMKIIRSIQQMQQMSYEYTINKKKIGFVPTMGFFHEGHLSLMKRERDENDVVVTSVFVNTLQLGRNEDCDQSDVDETIDIQLAQETGVDVLSMPDKDEMYPQPMLVTLSLAGRTVVLCGRSRSGLFDGVITVLTKL